MKDETEASGCEAVYTHFFKRKLIIFFNVVKIWYVFVSGNNSNVSLIVSVIFGQSCLGDASIMSDTAVSTFIVINLL